jgi:arylsulfatase A-like enzyme
MIQPNRALIGLMVLAVASLVVLPQAVIAGQSKDRPNIILAMTDDQGYGDAGYLGDPHLNTPTLDAMAKAGLRMDRFYATPICSPTRAGFLTGRHPNRNGTFEWGHALRPREHTIAEALQTAGYRTGHFGKWHVGSVLKGAETNPGAQGFDVWVSTPNFYDNDPIMSRQGQAVQLNGESSVVTVEQAIKFINNAAEGEAPFLAVVWFGNPHWPHEAEPDLRQPYADHPKDMPDYYGELTGIDRAMSRLRQRLRELGIADDTMLWFMSDNGGDAPEANNGGLRGHKGQLWEGGVRVPSIIEWPGHVTGRRTAMPSTVMDIYPTLLDLAGVEKPHDRPLDGVSLMPLIEGEKQTRQKPIPFWRKPAKGQPTPSDELMAKLKKAQADNRQPDWPEFRRHPITASYPRAAKRAGPAAWLDADWKLHRRPNGKYLLYNLAEDRDEQNNVIDQYPKRAKRMKRQLKAWQQSVHASLKGADYAN